MEKEIKAQYGRVKGAPWFPLLHKRDIMVLGQGGIGSWTSLLLSRLGANLYLYDMDTYEDHNMTGQIFIQSGIGKNKAEAAKELIKLASPDCEVEAIAEKYTTDSPTNDIVVCGFDNMVTRKVAFINWKLQLEVYPERAKDFFFQDGRLLAEQFQIFNIPGDRHDLINEYQKDWLFDDSEATEGDCTFKQTSHVAAMIASKMVGFVTNWATNANAGKMIRVVPFKDEFLVPLNLKL